MAISLGFDQLWLQSVVKNLIANRSWSRQALLSTHSGSIRERRWSKAYCHWNYYAVSIAWVISKWRAIKFYNWLYILKTSYRLKTGLPAYRITFPVTMKYYGKFIIYFSILFSKEVDTFLVIDLFHRFSGCTVIVRSKHSDSCISWSTVDYHDICIL